MKIPISFFQLLPDDVYRVDQFPKDNLQPVWLFLGQMSILFRNFTSI